MKLKKMPAFAAALFIAAAFCAPRLFAQEGACKADIEKLCKDVQPGNGGLKKCLKEHEAELSAECQAKLKEGRQDKNEGAGGKMTGEMKAAMKEINETCKADLDKFCKDVKPGEGRIFKCLKENEAALSEVCKAKLSEQKVKALKEHPCLADMEKFCKDVKPGEGRVMDCMKTHEAEFSAACKASMAEKKESMMKNNPCSSDIDKFCKDVQRGEGRIMKCLKEHEAELSDACKAGEAEMKEKRQGMKAGRGEHGGDAPAETAQPAPETK